MRPFLIPILIALFACCWVSFRDHPTRFTASDPQFRQTYGDWAIVAGASEGLGAAWAEALCQLGVNVLLVARREPALKTLASDLETRYNGISVDYWVQDLAASNLEDSFRQRLQQERKYGLLVYNAAYSAVGRFLENPLEKHYTTLDVDTRGIVTLTHILASHWKQKQQTGGIILMSSMSGELGTAYVANYAATKAWITTFAHGINYELKPLGIDVLSCVAGATTTPSYLEASRVRNPVIEQTAEQVVDECIQAIGARSSIRTGVLNKLVRFLFVRLLPLEMALSIFNGETEKTLAG